MSDDIKQLLTNALQQQFGFSTFRPGQIEALSVLMTEGRLLCIQPTGHGKSLLYQLPATLLDGLTVVISPLLALMRDQINQLQNRFHIEAASLNTDQSEQENNLARRNILSGKVKILFIAPEQLDHLERFQFLLGLPIKLLVVDEAHCISTWGHDFRPSYRQIIQLVHAISKKSPDIKLLALTATANKLTEDDIKKQLTIDQQPLIVHRENMDRPNIRLTVIKTSGTSTKLATLINLMHELTGCGLIYCATRENTELVAEFLISQGIQAAAYHAGFETEEKRRIQQAFLEDQYTVISATNALGMGIDKSNLRFIIHYDFPGSITAYYQEVGRCGRDGLPADGILLYDATDSNIQRHFIDSAQPTADDFDYIIRLIRSAELPATLMYLKRLSGMHPSKLNVIIAELIEQAYLKKIIYTGQQTYHLTDKNTKPTLKRYDTQYQIRKLELANMQRYAEHTSACLMMTLREALGDIKPTTCQRCSHCTKSLFSPSRDQDLISAITLWIDSRTIPIVLSKKISNTATGVALLDGKLRSDAFTHFMRERAKIPSLTECMPHALLDLIKKTLLELTKRHQFSCIIPIPSRTWLAQSNLLNELSVYLKIPAMKDALTWINIPSARQGELLNNDQRKHNVSQRMQTRPEHSVPDGTILLLDDYLGSGATMSEAARCLREQGNFTNKIVPFTIAAVKWKLGKQGMI